MKIQYLALRYLTLLSSAPLHGEGEELTTQFLHSYADELSIDQQIISCIQAPEFSNSLFMYPFEGKEYPIRVIHNPKKETLISAGLNTPYRASLIAVADLPYRLAAHIEDLVNPLVVEDDTLLSLVHGDALGIHKTMHPVHIAETIDDPVNDERIKEAFCSQEFVHLELHYSLNGLYTPVRLLYNPQRRAFTATRSYNLLWGNTPVTITWDHIYGIFTQKRVKTELINHIYDLSNASLLEWYVNFDVQNGEKVRHRIDFGNTTYNYSLNTWFEYTEDFR